MKETHTIDDLGKLRLLADPLKLGILQAFAEGAKTTRQVASELDENITKLYRHVDALFDAGLLEVVEEQRKRGTVERTFRAVAKRFEVDRSLFADRSDAAAVNTVRDVLRATEEEVLGALESAGQDDEHQAIFVRLRCKASPRRIAELQASLEAWLEAAQAEDDCDVEASEEIGALIAFYPVNRGD